MLSTQIIRSLDSNRTLGDLTTRLFAALPMN